MLTTVKGGGDRSDLRGVRVSGRDTGSRDSPNCGRVRLQRDRQVNISVYPFPGGSLQCHLMNPRYDDKLSSG